MSKKAVALFILLALAAFGAWWLRTAPESAPRGPRLYGRGSIHKQIRLFYGNDRAGGGLKMVRLGARGHQHLHFYILSADLLGQTIRHIA